MSDITVYSRNKVAVSAKFLYDSYGKAVVDPATGNPLIVPASYNTRVAVSWGEGFRTVSNESIFGTVALDAAMAMRFQPFISAGQGDLQRNYNGNGGGGVMEVIFS